MLMGVGVPVKALGPADHAHAADHAVLGQSVQVAVDGAQADVGAALPGQRVNLLGGEVLLFLLNDFLNDLALP